MKKFINRIKNVNPFGLFAIGLVVGIAIMYLIFQPHLVYQGKTAKDWSSLATENMNSTSEYSKKLSDLNKKYASVSAALQGLLNAPTPTPEIIYKQQSSSQALPQPQVKCLAYSGTNCVETQLPAGSF